jgi:hypothetical protein
VTSVAAGICIVFLLFIEGDEVIVYETGFKYTRLSILKMRRRNKFYEFSEVKRIKIEGDFGTADELEDRPSKRGFNTVELHLRDGSIDTFPTTIYIEKLKKCVEYIQKRTG